MNSTHTAIERNLRLFDNFQTDYVPLRDYEFNEPPPRDESVFNTQTSSQPHTIR